MIFGRKWLNRIPSNLRPSGNGGRALEKLRTEYDICHKDFATAVMGSKGMTWKVTRQRLESLRHQFPGLSEQRLLKEALISRIRTNSIASGQFFFQMTPTLESEVDQIMVNISSLDDLCLFFIAAENSNPHIPGVPGCVWDPIDQILKQEADNVEQNPSTASSRA